MQFLKISNDMTFPQLSSTVGHRNVENVLSLNGLKRSYDVGKQYTELCSDIAFTDKTVDWQKKSSILNSFTTDSDIFEHAALLGDSGWKSLAKIGSFPGMLKIPDGAELPDSISTIGNGESVSKLIYTKVMKQIKDEPHEVDPSIFNAISSVRPSSIMNGGSSSSGASSIFEQFHIPWGNVTIYSSLSDNSIDFPVYPETMDDGIRASYTEMPDMLYQYEPWQVYHSSGPRTCSYEFHMHRDMWTGDHRDGKCNELIRFCKAQCYPKYSGSSVISSIVKLYVSGSLLISGIMQEAKVSWSGPIGIDGWYLECTLSITITEISEDPLNHDTVLAKPIIG